MSKELTLKSNSPTDINKAFGFESSKPKPVIPVLKINGSDDEDGTKAPKGTFVYDNGDKILYANEVSIRTFYKGYQYKLYSATDPSKNDTSIIAKTFRDEYRSISGRLACGKMPKKRYMELGDNVTAQQKFLQDNVKCKLLIFGLVSGEFINLDTKEKEIVEDALFTWIVSQSGFMAVDQAVTGIEKERRAVPLTPIKLMLKKEKMGSVTFYVPIPVVGGDSVALDIKRDGAYLNQIDSFISDNNSYINSKYNEATKGKNEDSNFAKVAQAVDVNDEIPF